MDNEEIYKRINEWIEVTPIDERVCLLSMCKNWMKHQEDVVISLQSELEKAHRDNKCLSCGAKVQGTGDFCVIYCKHNKISDLRNNNLDNYVSKVID